MINALYLIGGLFIDKQVLEFLLYDSIIGYCQAQFTLGWKSTKWTWSCVDL